MIAQLKGRLIEKNPTELVIDCGGVGYSVSVSLYTYSQLPEGETVQVYTYLLVREDAQELYGFYTKSERKVFKLLISVSGVGASTARTMLSSLEPEVISQAVLNEDVKTIQTVKGIGAKTAKRLIIDLKDKIAKVMGDSEISPAVSNTGKDEALSALGTLGYTEKQSRKVVDKIISENPDSGVEQIIKKALKQL